MHSPLNSVLALGDVIQPALVCPIHCTASCLVCPPVCPLHYPLALYWVYVMSSSQLICSHLVPNTAAHSIMQTSISLPLLWLLPIKQERDFYMNICIYRYIILKISYSDIIMRLKVDKMLSHQQRKGSEEWYNHKILQYDSLTYSLGNLKKI